MIAFFRAGRVASLYLSRHCGLPPLFALTCLLLAWFAPLSWSQTSTPQALVKPPSTEHVVRIGAYDLGPVMSGPNAGTKGILPDVLREVADREGWRIEFVHDTLAGGADSLDRGLIDLLLLGYDPELRERFRFGDETLLTTWGQVFARKDLHLQSVLDLAGKTIAIQENDGASRKLLESFGLNVIIVETKDHADMLAGIEAGWLDAAVIDRFAAQAYDQSSGNVVRTSLILAPVDLRFAASARQAANLVGALDFHLANLRRDQNSVYYRALNKWLAGEPSPTGLPAWLRYLLLGVGLVVLLVIGWSLTLRMRIKVATRELRRKNEELQAQMQERRRAEESYMRVAAAMEQSDEIVIITDAAGVIQYVNPAFERISGYSRLEAVGRTPRILKSDLHDGAFYQQMWQRLSHGDVWRSNLVNRKKDGTTYEAEATISPVRDSSGAIINYVGVQHDITEQNRLERQVRQSQKMEAIGTMAGGIAHDFNNILTPIIGYTQIALRRLPTEHEALRHHLNQVLQGSLRAKDLIQQILTFSRQGEQTRSVLQVGAIIKEVLKLLRASLPSTIEIRQKLPTAGDHIQCDPVQIHQVLMNLCTNAAHAMRERGGVLEVQLAPAQPGPELLPQSEPPPADGYIRLSISDTGHGIPDDIRERIFDPFFTTKKRGEGTGMGLAVVHGIVRNHSGLISVTSKVGLGTRFDVYFPLARARVDVPEPRSVEVRPGEEHILLVDDEEAITRMGALILSELGYLVDVCASGNAALELFMSDPNRYDLVLTDQTMPGMTGADLAVTLLRMRPKLPIILCTGFSESINAELARQLGIREFMLKPYESHELGQVIRRVLDEPLTRTVPMF